VFDGRDRILARIGRTGIPSKKTDLERPAKSAGQSSRL
jgi:hypothetical protein